MSQPIRGQGGHLVFPIGPKNTNFSTSSTKFVFFGPMGKTRWPPWPLIGWDIFDFSSETAERNSTKLDRKQDLNVLYQVCVFRADQKNNMAALAWLAETFSTSPLKPLNKDSLNSVQRFQRRSWKCLRQSEARAAILFFRSARKTQTSQRPLPSLCFSGRSEKQDGRPGLWLSETFSTSPLKPLNEIQRNLTGSKISTSSTKFVFFGPIGKTRWPPWPLIVWDIFNFSSETAERNSTNLYRKQDLNILYQVCVFRVDRKNKMAALASDWPRHFRLLLWNRWTEFNETWQEARYQRPLPSLCFSGRSVNKNVRLGQFLKEVAHCTQVHDMWPFGPLVLVHQRNLPNFKRSKYLTSSTRVLVFSGQSESKNGRPGLFFDRDIFDFSTAIAERNYRFCNHKTDFGET